MDGQVDPTYKTLPATNGRSTEKGEKGAFFNLLKTTL